MAFGSLYGMLRKQLSSSAPCGQEVPPAGGRKVPPGKRTMERQRSKSLIQRSVALSEEKSIIKLLCDYTEMRRIRDNLVLGTMPGARRRGRPCTAWTDDIKTWTRLPVVKSVRLTEDRDKRRKYVDGVASPRIEDG